MMETLRANLTDAIEAQREAERRLGEAAGAVQGADRFIASLDEVVDAFAGVDARIAEERAEAIRDALASGAVPSMSISAELADATARRAEAQNQLSAAKQARHALLKAEDVAKVAVDDARTAAAAAVAAIVRAEADAIAREVERLEAEAMQLRAKLAGAEFVPVAAVPAPPGDAERRVLGGNGKTDIVIRNMPLWRLAEDYRARWRSFAMQLQFDPSAVLEIAQ